MYLVLVKIDGVLVGVRGILVFIVSKWWVNVDGLLGVRNDVQFVGFNYKMGYCSMMNMLLNFGDNGACIGHLVGELYRGLDYMFMMMNEVRIGVGLGVMLLGIAGYCYSLDYAKNRPQGRALDNKDPISPPVAIIQHADIRWLLLAQKVVTEGALALCFYALIWWTTSIPRSMWLVVSVRACCWICIISWMLFTKPRSSFPFRTAL